jgi:hypothetical protein
MNSNQSQKSCRKYKSENGQTGTSDHIRDGIRCLGVVSIPCRPATLDASTISGSGKRYEPLSRSVCRERLNDWYETYQTACGSKEGCMAKPDYCNDQKICGKLLVNKTVKTLVISTCLSVNCLELKTDRMSKRICISNQQRDINTICKWRWNITT